MVKNPIKKNDLKNFGLTKNLFEELEVLMDSKEYVEIASQKLFLGTRENNQMSVIYIENEEDAIFFKNIRDNISDIRLMLRSRNIIKKIKNDTINKNHFFISYIIKNKIKTERKEVGLSFKNKRLYERINKKGEYQN
jgi:hypothetical protein